MAVIGTTKSNSIKLKVLVILCSTLVLMGGIGAWIYISQQQIAQRDRELTQERQLKEYEQEQLNKRNTEDNRVERLNGMGSNPFLGQ